MTRKEATLNYENMELWIINNNNNGDPMTLVIYILQTYTVSEEKEIAKEVEGEKGRKYRSLDRTIWTW